MKKTATPLNEVDTRRLLRSTRALDDAFIARDDALRERASAHRVDRADIAKHPIK